jgi:hypothetical protein
MAPAQDGAAAGWWFARAVRGIEDASKAFPPLNASQMARPRYAEDRRKEKPTVMILSLSMLRGLGKPIVGCPNQGLRRWTSPLSDRMAVPIDARFWQKIAPAGFEWGTSKKRANPTAPGARGGKIIALANCIADTY